MGGKNYNGPNFLRKGGFKLCGKGLIKTVPIDWALLSLNRCRYSNNDAGFCATLPVALISVLGYAGG